MKQKYTAKSFGDLLKVINTLNKLILTSIIIDISSSDENEEMCTEAHEVLNENTRLTSQSLPHFQAPSNINEKSCTVPQDTLNAKSRLTSQSLPSNERNKSCINSREKAARDRKIKHVMDDLKEIYSLHISYEEVGEHMDIGFFRDHSNLVNFLAGLHKRKSVLKLNDSLTNVIEK